MSGPPPLSWNVLLTTWQPQVAWAVPLALLAVLYLAARIRAGTASTVRGWRVACWLAGLALTWGVVASAVGEYAMSLFWMHMVLHLLLIMVVPALLVLGHPLTVLVEAFEREQSLRSTLRSWPASILTHPLTGVLVYTTVIIGTHLTGFMDQMAEHTWLMTGEQVAYIVAGVLFLLPLVGEEPIRSNPPYLLRLVILVAAMVPDTVVGLVLLQTDRDPFPVMMGMHPDWAPNALSDIHTAGGLMWTAGDGLMMLIAVGLMISVIVTPARRDRMTGAWLDSARRHALTAHVSAAGAGGAAGDVDLDSEEALDAYNRMLADLDRER